MKVGYAKITPTNRLTMTVAAVRVAYAQILIATKTRILFSQISTVAW